MNIFFHSCCLRFGVSCPGPLAESLRAVVGPFELSGQALPLAGRIEIGLGVRVDDRGLAQEGLPEEYRPYLSLLSNDASGLRVGLATGSPWEVSAAVGMLVARALAEHRGLLLHSAMLLDGDKIHLLLGPSGAGKSTAADLAAPMLCIHDDKAAVRKMGGEWLAFGTPMLGNHGVPGLNREARLSSLNLVVKSSEDRRIIMDARRATDLLAENVILPAVADRNALARSFLGLASEIPTYALHFSKRTRVAELLG